ncbi:MAG: hypothetical protein MI749_21460, partial [Desulfovibrionales bacterium]|nr:hypothetical protein [Desulfovibrionales bacterium]
RPDFDGIVCAVLLYEALDIRREVFWTEPNEVQTGQAPIQEGDIMANLPHDPRCSVWFDHHVSNAPDTPVEGAFAIAPSAAGVIYTHYQNQGKLDSRFDELVHHTDLIDSADLTMDQVKTPEDHPHVILSMTIQNKDYQDKAYWNHLVDLLRTRDMDQVMADPEVATRVAAVIKENREFATHLKNHTRIHQGISVTDFRSLDPVPSGNRFLTYCLFPETMASIRIRFHGPKFVLISVGHSIFNPTCKLNVGHLLSRYGGGGHFGAGGCTLNANTAQEKIDEILDLLAANHPLD